MTHQHQVAPASRTRRWQPKLRGELLCALALKLVLLLAIKAAFFPQRMPEQAIAQGVADRMASQNFPADETVKKDKP